MGGVERDCFLYVLSCCSTITAGQLLDDWDRADYQLLYGSNELRVPVKSFFELLLVEMVHPFYVFQYASVTIW